MIKLKDYRNLPKTLGIYKVYCSGNNKYYIGSTWHESRGFRKRASRHYNELKNSKHDNPYLQRAWNKYGEESFYFEILEEIPDIEKRIIQDIEQLYLDFTNCTNINFGFNLSKFANGGPGNPLTEEHKNKLIEIRSKSYTLISPEGKIVSGKNISDLARSEGISMSNLSRLVDGKLKNIKGWTNCFRHHLEQKYYGTCNKSVTNIKPVYLRNDKFGTVKVYSSATFCRDFNLPKSAFQSIRKILIGKAKSYKDWTLVEQVSAQKPDG